MQKPWCSNTEERRKTDTNPATENTGLENATVSNTERENALIYEHEFNQPHQQQCK